MKTWLKCLLIGLPVVGFLIVFPDGLGTRTVIVIAAVVAGGELWELIVRTRDIQVTLHIIRRRLENYSGPLCSKCSGEHETVDCKQ